MTYLRGFRLLLVLALLSVVVTGLPTAVGAQTSDDVERERRELERARARAAEALEELRAANAALDAALLELNEINGELASLTWKTTQLRTRTSEYRQESDELRDRAESLVRDAYIGGRGDLLQNSLEAATIQDVVTRQLILDHAANADLVSITRLEAVSREMDRLQVELADDLDRVAELRALSDLVVRRMETARQRADDAFARAQELAADQLDDFREAERLKRLKDLEEKKRKEGASGGLPITRTPGGSARCPVASSSTTGASHDPVAERTRAPTSSPHGALTPWRLRRGHCGSTPTASGERSCGCEATTASTTTTPTSTAIPATSARQPGTEGPGHRFRGQHGQRHHHVTAPPFPDAPGGGIAVNPYPTLAAHC